MFFIAYLLILLVNIGILIYTIFYPSPLFVTILGGGAAGVCIVRLHTIAREKEDEAFLQTLRGE